MTDQRALETGEFHAYCFRVKEQVESRATDASSSASSSSFLDRLPFRATLVWSDPPASLAASWLLVNNLDLSVYDRSSDRLYVGNQHWTDHEPMFDTTNNVEQVTIPHHLLTTNGLISVHVRGSSVPIDGPQKYALVVNGQFDALPLEACTASLPSPPSAVSLSPLCPNRCSGHGTCSRDGVCQCEIGYGGPACSQTSVRLAACLDVTSQVPMSKFTYFHFDVPEPIAHSTPAPSPSPPPLAPSSADLLNGPMPPPPPPSSSSSSQLSYPSIRILMQAINGEPDLYVSHGRLPTIQDHDYVHMLPSVNQKLDPSTSDAPHLTSQVDIPLARPGRYYIGVLGYCCSAVSRFRIQLLRCQQSTAAPSNEDGSTAPTVATKTSFMSPVAKLQLTKPAVSSRDCSCVQGIYEH